MIQRGEVDLHREPPFEDGVVVKLGAVVERECFEVAAMPADGARGRPRHLLGVASGQLLDDRETGLTLDQREHAMSKVTSHDGVAFPMTDALSLLDFQRPLGNAAFAGQYAP
jgi:hypothetical protein